MRKPRLLLDERQMNAEGAAATERGADGDEAAVLADDAIGHAEAETRAFAHVFGREEGFEDMVHELLTHALTVVPDGEHREGLRNVRVAWPDFHFDLARPGAALYGLAPVAGEANPMRPVVRLRGRIVQLRDIPSGAPVGYGANWTAVRPSRIATVSVGYADGYLRSLSHRATAHVGDKGVPLVGIVSMDSITLDVTDAQEAVAGGSPLSPSIARRIVGAFSSVERQTVLTPRERGVLEHLVQGASYAEIADAMDVQMSTVQTHVKSLYKKLRVTSRTAAGERARRLGLLPERKP